MGVRTKVQSPLRTLNKKIAEFPEASIPKFVFSIENTHKWSILINFENFLSINKFLKESKCQTFPKSGEKLKIKLK